jgi:hypothetical protein
MLKLKSPKTGNFSGHPFYPCLQLDGWSTPHFSEDIPKPRTRWWHFNVPKSNHMFSDVSLCHMRRQVSRTVWLHLPMPKMRLFSCSSLCDSTRRLEELRQHEENRRREAMRSRQIAERLGVEEAHMLEFQQFNALWDKRMAEFEQKSADLDEAMKERHGTELMEYIRNAQSEPLR